MKWIVVGGTGFVGTNLCMRLKEAGHEVVAVDIRYPRQELRDKSLDRFMRYDIRVPFGPVVLPALKGADVMVMLAAISGLDSCARDPLGSFDVNVRGVVHTLDSCVKLGIPKFVFASSGAVMAGYKGSWDEYSIVKPESVYGGQKAAAEAMVQAYDRDYPDLTATSLRFSNIFGPWSEHKTSAVHKFVRSVIDEEPLQVVGSGDQQRDFVHVDDVCRAIAAVVCGEGKLNSVYNVGTGKGTTVRELAELVIHEAGEGSASFQSPGSVGALKSVMQIGEISMWVGWKPVVELEDGVRALIEWYMDR